MENKELIKGYTGFNPDLTCRDFKYDVGKEYDKVFRVDGEKIKSDTYYKLVNGEAIEVE